MELVGAGDDGGVELAAGGVTELGRELVGDEGEVADGIVGHVDEWAGDGLVVVVDAFNCEVIVTRALTADRWANTDTDTASGGDAGAQKRGVENAETNGWRWEVREFLGGEGRGEVGGRCVENHAGVGGDFNRLGGPYRQNDVLGCGPVDFDLEARQLIGLKSGVGDRYVICASRQVGSMEFAVGVGGKSRAQRRLPHWL